MFGISQQQLASALGKLCRGLCCYGASTSCDCKYGYDPDRLNCGEQTGCPEARLAATIIQKMTVEEYEKVCKRSHVSLPQELLLPGVK